MGTGWRMEVDGKWESWENIKQVLITKCSLLKFMVFNSDIDIVNCFSEHSVLLEACAQNLYTRAELGRADLRSDRSPPTMSTTQVLPAGITMAEISKIMVRAPDLPPQLERYISQPPRDESTPWGMIAMAGPKQGLDSPMSITESSRSGKKRGLQSIAEFEDKFGVEIVAGACLQANGAPACTERTRTVATQIEVSTNRAA